MGTDGREYVLLYSNWMRRTGWTEMFLGANRSFVIDREILAVRQKTDHYAHDAHQPIGQVLFALLQKSFKVVRALRGSLICW
jgi:hypothetical protein